MIILLRKYVLQEGKNLIGSVERQDDSATIFESLQAKYAAGN